MPNQPPPELRAVNDARKAMLVADENFASNPTPVHSLAVVNTQRVYYALLSRYLRAHCTSIAANVMRARHLRERAQQNEARLLKLRKQEGIGKGHRQLTDLERGIILAQRARTQVAQLRADYQYALQKEHDTPPALTSRPTLIVRVRHPLTRRFVTTTKEQANEWKDRYPDVYK